MSAVAVVDGREVDECELDALVAEKVFGRHVERLDQYTPPVWFWVGPANTLPGSPILLEDGREAHGIRPYSSDIAAAWGVIVSERLKDWSCDLVKVPADDGDENQAPIFLVVFGSAGPIASRTAPLAICLAALLAVDAARECRALPSAPLEDPAE